MHRPPRRHMMRRPGLNFPRPEKVGNVTCDIALQRGETPRILCQNLASANIRVTAQPQDKLEFHFKVCNMKNMDLQEVSLDDPQDQFDGYKLSDSVKKAFKSSDRVFVLSCCCETKDLQMSFKMKLKNKTTLHEITICKNVIVNVENVKSAKASPYRNKKWTAKEYVRAIKTEYDRRTNTVRCVPSTENMYDVPKKLRAIIDKDFNVQMLESQDRGEEADSNTALCSSKANLLRTYELYDFDSESEAESTKYDNLKLIMKYKRSEQNYKDFYHHLLWLDEMKELDNIEKYNLSEVILKKELIKKKQPKTKKDSEKSKKCTAKWYKLEVPGLSQKRPSLMPGDRAIISRYDPKTNSVEIEHEGYIKKVTKNDIFIYDFDESFENIYNSNTRFNVRFITNRAALESQHEALENSTEWRCRLFPEPVPSVEPRRIDRFFNPQIKNNAEQKAAVEHILSKCSGPAPYLVFGPPGTGKTMTIVEAIIQIVKADPAHKVWVCTNANMAADHVALQLMKYKPIFDTHTFLLRANSKDRDWECMPEELLEVSNGASRKNCDSLDNRAVLQFKIVVTTLHHAMKYTKPQYDRITDEEYEVKVSHLFIDEAAQATEPSCLVPLKLLTPQGQLVLAGDPCQLGPVIMSKLAKELGLGTSLMEHLFRTYTNLYGDDCPHKHQYITMLVNNFRSDADILHIPNEQFYGGKLKALAPLDPLSRASILGMAGGDHSIVFHSVECKAQKLGKIPSYMNKGEFKMLQTYIKALIDDHKVPPRDIGVISPYIRQVLVIKEWLQKKKYTDLEVGTVEAFQGKEKRAILVSTVRGGGAPTGVLKADLGFLVDKQRFNVAVTRAKAKLIVIGNPLFLKQDELWNAYIRRCKELGSFHQTSPTLDIYLDDLVIDDREYSPELDCLEHDEPSFSPELDCLEHDEPSFSPELDCLVHDEPSFSPELDCLEYDEPSFSPELDCLVHDEPSFSPELDCLEYDEPSFSPELDCLVHDEPSFSPELDF